MGVRQIDVEVADVGEPGEVGVESVTVVGFVSEKVEIVRTIRECYGAAGGPDCLRRRGPTIVAASVQKVEKRQGGAVIEADVRAGVEEKITLVVFGSFGVVGRPI